jgi:hypothetical protein
LKNPIPSKVFSDQGTEFKNKISAILSEKLLINHHFSLVGSHVSQAESAVKNTLNTLLKSLKEEFWNEPDQSWDKQLPKVMFALNSKVKKNGTSSFSLLFGRNPFHSDGSLFKSTDVDFTEKRQMLIKNWKWINEEIYPKTVELLKKSRSKQNSYKKRIEVDGMEFDNKHVMFKTTHPDKKMSAKGKVSFRYTGPFLAKKSQSSSSYSLFDKNNVFVCKAASHMLKKTNITDLSVLDVKSSVIHVVEDEVDSLKTVDDQSFHDDDSKDLKTGSSFKSLSRQFKELSENHAPLAKRVKKNHTRFDESTDFDQ